MTAVELKFFMWWGLFWMSNYSYSPRIINKSDCEHRYLSMAHSSSEDGSVIEDEWNGIVFTRLNEVVRKQYFDFLEKLLRENYEAGCKDKNQFPKEGCIQACASKLEDKAMKSSMVVQIYRREIVKIIAKIRRNTEKCRLDRNLQMIIEGRDQAKTHESRSTQTDDERLRHRITGDNDDEFTSVSLMRKMEMFEEKLHNESSTFYKKRPKPKKKLYPSRRKRKKLDISPTSSPISMPPVTPAINEGEVSVTLKGDDEEGEDEIAQELAQLFNEDNNEIDDIFGFHSNAQPDDPQIENILKEIESAKISHTTSDVNSKPDTDLNSFAGSLNEPESKSDTMTKKYKVSTDLRNSLWPCELFMQRRRLSETLSRLIEEDFRWNEIIRWKFVSLFGEDSDDEFATLSPSIELDDVLMSSCVKRISSWVVKHLMRPMNDGLIANRFLFKKLAKKLSRSIIMENQYPEEKMIKTAVENFFCIHKAVLSTEDLEMPYILFNDYE